MLRYLRRTFDDVGDERQEWEGEEREKGRKERRGGKRQGEEREKGRKERGGRERRGEERERGEEGRGGKREGDEREGGGGEEGRRGGKRVVEWDNKVKRRETGVESENRKK